jgi:hypothetical protein
MPTGPTSHCRFPWWPTGLEELERVEEAVASDEEAVRAITGPLMARPQAWTERALTIARDYIRHCEKLGREPDIELLGPIAQVLQSMRESPPDEAGQWWEVSEHGECLGRAGAWTR